MTDTIDVNFRPGTYFRPHRLEEYLLTRVRGRAARRLLRELFAAGRHDDAVQLLGPDGLDPSLQRSLERIHPRYMGGAYLPAMRPNEVEIASVTLASTLSDVTSVYVRKSGSRFHYRVVDEYNGEMLQGRTTRTSVRPLTLRELTEFFFGAWDLLDLLDSTFDDEYRHEMLDFFSASSSFYLDFGAYSRQLVHARFPELAQEIHDDEDDDGLNRLPQRELTCGTETGAATDGQADPVLRT